MSCSEELFCNSFGQDAEKIREYLRKKSADFQEGRADTPDAPIYYTPPFSGAQSRGFKEVWPENSWLIFRFLDLQCISRDVEEGGVEFMYSPFASSYLPITYFVRIN